MYTLQSKTDTFHVNQKVIDASAFLKNLSELTEITEPIVLVCSTHCLMTYINLINHYDTITKDHDSIFEYRLFKRFNNFMIAELVKETAILDSDFFIDAVADIILDRIREMNWKEMQEYFDVEDDFTQDERKQIEADKLDFLIHGQQIDNGKNFLTLENKFYTPMNAFLARVIQRSDAQVSFTLSTINKTLKNEVNRHPIKVMNLEGGHSWRIEIYGILNMGLSETDLQTYFNAFKRRKIIVDWRAQMFFNVDIQPKTIHLTPLDFVVPRKNQYLDVLFSKSANQIYNFDIQKCPFSSINYTFCNISISIDFDKVYQQLVAKDLSKEIRIRFGGSVNFLPIDLLKKTTNASRFYTITLFDEKSLQALKPFIKKYMEDDGFIESRRKIFESLVPHKGVLPGLYYYKLSDINFL